MTTCRKVSYRFGVSEDGKGWIDVPFIGETIISPGDSTDELDRQAVKDYILNRDQGSFPAWVKEPRNYTRLVRVEVIRED